jgi:hypothetical protein
MVSLCIVWGCFFLCSRGVCNANVEYDPILLKYIYALTISVDTYNGFNCEPPCVLGNGIGNYTRYTTISTNERKEK